MSDIWLCRAVSVAFLISAASLPLGESMKACDVLVGVMLFCTSMILDELKRGKE